MDQGDGTWSTTKEILGWLVDGANITIQLMPDKCEKIARLIKKVCKTKFCAVVKFQELAGKLQHASFGIPGGKGLFLPIHRALKNPVNPIHITAALRSALLDWRTLVQQSLRDVEKYSSTDLTLPECQVPNWSISSKQISL